MMYLRRAPRDHISHFFAAVSRSGIFAAFAIAISCTFIISGVVHGAPNTAAVAAQQPSVPNTGGIGVSLPATSNTPALPMREVHIANNGAVYLRGARITRIEASSISVRAGWGSMEFDWDVTTNVGTHFINAKGETIRIGVLKVGDIVAVTGVLDQSADSASMRAQYIRISALQN